MGYEKITRNRYYEPPSVSLPGGFEYPHTSRNHYEDQLEYDQPLERVHQSNLHDWGIASGLSVTGSPGSTSVVIEAGAAVDINGTLLVLATDGSGDVGANPEASQHEEQSTPITLDLSSQLDSLCYVTISHSEIIRPGEGSGGRSERIPWVRLQPVAGAGAYVNDGLSVILALVDINASGELVSLSSESSSAPLPRRLMDNKTRDLILQRASKTGNTVSEREAGRLAPSEGGGLTLSLPNLGDTLSVQRTSSANVSSVDLRSNTLNVIDSSGRNAFNFRSSTASLSLGTAGNEGDLLVYDSAGNTALHIDGASAKIDVGTDDNAGDLYIRDSNNERAIDLDGNNAILRVGTTNNDGDIIVRDSSNRNAITMDGNNAWLKVGEEGNEGDIEVKDGTGTRVFHFNGANALLEIGATGNEGDIRVRDNAGTDTIRLDGETGTIICNGYNILGNPARKVSVVWFLTTDGTDFEEIDLGSPRQVFAHAVMFGMDPLADHDSHDGFSIDIHRIDGAINPSQFASGGEHWGPSGSSTAIKSPHFRGTAQRIQFRARSFDNATLFGMGIVYWE